MAAIFFGRDDPESGVSCDTVVTYMVVMEDLLINFGFLQDLIFLSPSLKFSCLLYTPIFFATQFVHLVLRHDSGVPNLPIKLTFFAVLFPMIALHYYLVTLWDLKRFMEEKRLSQNHRTHILRIAENLTDACVIINSANEKEADPSQGVPFPIVSYCNEPSTRMFDFDISKETAESL